MLDTLQKYFSVEKKSDSYSYISLSPSQENSVAECGIRFFSSAQDCEITNRGTIQPISHSFYLMVHVIKGSGWFWTVDNGRSPVKESNLLIVSPDSVYDFGASTEGALVDFITLDGVLPNSLLDSKVLKEGIWEFGSTRKLISILELIALGDKESHFKAASQFMSLVTDTHFENKYLVPQKGESKIQHLTQLIQKSPEKQWDCQEMAKYCNLSEVQLRRVFKKEIGHSPKVYVDSVKMNHAAQLLKKDFSVGIVSDLLGYSDQFHFSRRFKSILGASPREYLQQNR
ncbi:MAG: AraC family transcriptional regulator [Fibrobacterales bacterium]